MPVTLISLLVKSSFPPGIKDTEPVRIPMSTKDRLELLWLRALSMWSCSAL